MGNLSKISPTIAEYQTKRIQSARRAVVLEDDPEVFPNNWLG